MARELTVSIGQYSNQGRKPVNQDFHGAMIPDGPALGLKGIAVALADGISSSAVGRIASESAIAGFLSDYYCTPDSWSPKTAAQRVIDATNSWLHAQGRRGPYAHDKDKGYVCTFDAMVFKSRAAHIFHIGDARIYRLSGQSLEQLTDDHRVVVSSEESYLGRALGVNAQVEIDYRIVPLETGDVFVLATDGVYEHVGARFVSDTIAADFDMAAKTIVEAAYGNGSTDNLTVQIVRIDSLPDGEIGEILGQAAELQLPPLLEARSVFDGYDILRELHASSRSHVYLAKDRDTGAMVALKIPSIDLREDADYLRRFLLEEWVARRLNSAHVLKAAVPPRDKKFLYTVTEFVEGTTLAQWMADNPGADLETVRGIVEQIAAGLRAFHRMEMVHRDLRPENVLIDKAGTVKIIDFGATKIAGIAANDGVLGTVQYSAPEYLLGEDSSPRSDIFSLGAIAYRMLTGKLPYGARMAQARTKGQQRKIAYTPATGIARAVPDWVDAALRKALHPDPMKRYGELSEFVHDLRQPNPTFLNAEPPALIERNPLVFWQTLCAILACVILGLLLYPAR
ncbi:MAG: bifunctional protein-serine/threonine kinase/phosphatase [Rhodospirillales bacterium]